MGGCSSKENINPDKTEAPVVQCPTPVFYFEYSL